LHLFKLTKPVLAGQVNIKLLVVQALHIQQNHCLSRQKIKETQDSEATVILRNISSIVESDILWTVTIQILPVTECSPTVKQHNKHSTKEGNRRWFIDCYDLLHLSDITH